MQTKNLQMHETSDKIWCVHKSRYCCFLCTDCAGKNSLTMTWEKILKALYQPAVGGDRVADEFKKK